MQGLFQEEMVSPESFREVHSSRVDWIATVSQQHKLVRYHLLITSLAFFPKIIPNKNFIF